MLQYLVSTKKIVIYSSWQTCKYILNFGKYIISYIMAKKLIEYPDYIPKIQRIYINILYPQIKAENSNDP